jgi:hypothetical protein
MCPTACWSGLAGCRRRSPPARATRTRQQPTVLPAASSPLAWHTAGLRRRRARLAASPGAGSLLIVGTAAVALGWLVAGRMLTPLVQVTDTARRIAAVPAGGQGLQRRIALEGGPRRSTSSATSAPAARRRPVPGSVCEVTAVRRTDGGLVVTVTARPPPAPTGNCSKVRLSLSE